MLIKDGGIVVTPQGGFYHFVTTQGACLVQLLCRKTYWPTHLHSRCPCAFTRMGAWVHVSETDRSLSDKGSRSRKQKSEQKDNGRFLKTRNSKKNQGEARRTAR